MTVAMGSEKTFDIRSVLDDRVMRPIGVAEDEWSCGYGKTYDVDGLPLVASKFRPSEPHCDAHEGWMAGVAGPYPKEKQPMAGG